MAQQHIALTADNILNRSEMTRFERSDYKKKLVSANHAPPLEFCKSCSSGTPCQRQHAILTSSKYRRNIIEWEDINLLPTLEVLLQIKSFWQNFDFNKKLNDEDKEMAYLKYEFI